MAVESKRFEDWEQVDCNECEHWWTNRCDGASRGSRVGCNSYLATRSVVIPERLNSLEKRVKWLRISCLFAELALLLHFISHFLEWYNG